MKKLFMLCVTALLSLSLMAGVAFAAKYKPGTYKGSAVGFTKKGHPGKIEVEVTVDADSIKNINIVTYEQTLKGKRGDSVKEAKEKVPAEILAKQTVTVDGIAKASMSSDGIKLAVAQALEQATVKYKDGTYKGTAKGYSKKGHPGKIVVEVTVAGGKISKIDVVEFEQTLKGKRGDSVKKAKEKVLADILAKQSVAVDSIAKASMSSDGIKLAVANALEQAR